MNINPADSTSVIPSILILSAAVSFSQGCPGKCFMQLLPNPSSDTSLHREALEHSYL